MQDYNKIKGYKIKVSAPSLFVCLLFLISLVLLMMLCFPLQSQEAGKTFDKQVKELKNDASL